MPDPLLFQPLALRGVTAPNRIMLSPMQQYASPDGLAGDFHLVHLGRYALGGVGIVMVEVTAIEPRGRISHHDLGLWDDTQIAPLRRISDFLSNQGAVPAIQLGHAGRKAGIQAPWDGFGPLTEADAARGEAPWSTIGPSALAAGEDWRVPAEMSEADMEANVALWAAAAHRAAQAGFKVVELHGAHGYLLHSFLSPISNRRGDLYGGSLANRMRFPLAVVEAVRAALPADCAFFYRLSALDGVEGGWTLDESIVFCRELLTRGVDLIDCSSGGATADRSFEARVRRGFAFHAPYSRHLRERIDGPVATVGLIVQPDQAEAVLQAGDADLIVVGRELLADPNWPRRAKHLLCGQSYEDWQREAGWWLDKRMPVIAKLRESGETPLTRYRR